MVHRRFVRVAADTGKTLWETLQGIQAYLTAVVIIEFDDYQYKREVAVLGQLKENALLGMNVPLWPHLFKLLSAEEIAQIKTLVQQEETSYAVTTRAQAKQRDSQKESEQEADDQTEIVTESVENESEDTPLPNHGQTDATNQIIPTEISGNQITEEIVVSQEFPFHNTLFTNREKTKVYKTRAERRRCRWEFREQRLTCEELIKAQWEEPDIQQWTDQVKPI